MKSMLWPWVGLLDGYDFQSLSHSGSVVFLFSFRLAHRCLSSMPEDPSRCESNVTQVCSKVLSGVSSLHACLMSQVLAQLDFLKFWKENEACKTDVCLLPGQLDEPAGRCTFSVVLTVFSQERADSAVLKVKFRTHWLVIL